MSSHISVGHTSHTCLSMRSRFFCSHHSDWFYSLSFLPAWGARLACSKGIHPCTQPAGTGCTHSPRSPSHKHHRAGVIGPDHLHASPGAGHTPWRTAPCSPRSGNGIFLTHLQFCTELALPMDQGMSLACGGYCHMPSSTCPQLSTQSLQQTSLSFTLLLFSRRCHCPSLMSQRRGSPIMRSSVLSQQQDTQMPQQAKLIWGTDYNTSSSCSHPQMVVQNHRDLWSSPPPWHSLHGPAPVLPSPMIFVWVLCCSWDHMLGFLPFQLKSDSRDTPWR